jgi:hypothetical protein
MFRRSSSKDGSVFALFGTGLNGEKPFPSVVISCSEGVLIEPAHCIEPGNSVLLPFSGTTFWLVIFWLLLELMATTIKLTKVPEREILDFRFSI